MKVLKKISLSNVQPLSTDELKKVIGRGTGCEGKSQSSCSGPCTVDGKYSGYCGWTAASLNRCTCAVAYVG